MGASRGTAGPDAGINRGKLTDGARRRDGSRTEDRQVKIRMGKGIILVLAAALALASAGAALGETPTPLREAAMPAEPALELPPLTEGTITEIPVDQNSLKISTPPYDDRYLYRNGSVEATGYADPSITVNIGTGRIYETTYIYARVRIATPGQLRTLMASPVGNKNTTPGHDLAKRVNAVVAINGDFCGGEDITKGALMRQGEMLRLKCDEKFDLLVVDKAGDFHILENAKNSDVEAIRDEAVNIFTFGPALVVDGQPKYGVRNSNIATHKPAQRMAICQTGPLEYLLITSEGPQNKGSKGLTIDQFVDLVSSVADVRNAYNLDGGSSSTLVFRLEGKNLRKINALSNPKIRPLKDIIYFATAWEAPAATPVPEPTEVPAEILTEIPQAGTPETPDGPGNG